MAKARPHNWQKHRDAGDSIAIISASNRFCVQPFADFFNADHSMCSEPEIIDDKFTGVFVPPACFGAEKITHLNAWLENSGHSLTDSYFYTDSRNDIPLLERVDNPVAVNPDAYLSEYARERNWPVLDLR